MVQYASISCTLRLAAPFDTTSRPFLSYVYRHYLPSHHDIHLCRLSLFPFPAAILDRRSLHAFIMTTSARLVGGSAMGSKPGPWPEMIKLADVEGACP